MFKNKKALPPEDEKKIIRYHIFIWGCFVSVVFLQAFLAQTRLECVLLGYFNIIPLLFAFMTCLINKVKNGIDSNEKVKRDHHSAEENDTGKNDLLYALLRAIDAKDSYTYRHSCRVSHYARAIAKNMNLDSKGVEDIYISGMLHDIGKIGVRECVLNKKGGLDEQEREEIRKHPVLGAHIAGNLEYLTDIIPGIYYHHERYDGLGYPEGLKGENIPLTARILAVADSFDAMTAERVYRDAMSTEAATRELIQNIGKQFDPAVVLTFIELLRNKSV